MSLVVLLLLASASDAYALLEDGTYIYKDGDTVKLAFGNSCAMSPHLAGHVQETGTGDDPLSLRVYTALNMTVSYSDTVRNQSANPAKFTPFEPMPGNSANPDDKTVCWQ